MQLQEYHRNLYVNRILSGVIKIKLPEYPVYYIHPLTPLDKFLSDEIYIETLDELRFSDMMTEAEVLEMMFKEGFWTSDLQAELDKIPKAIEDYKLELFNSFFRSDRRDLFRKELAKKRERMIELHDKLHAFDHISQEGIAKMVKSQYIICQCLKDSNGNKVADYHTADSNMIEVVTYKYQDSLLSDDVLRSLARKEPWKSVWLAGKTEQSVFGKPAIELTEEQKSIILWSRMYDSIYDSVDCPPDFIIDDDDVLDGWLISQNRKREAEQSKKYGEKHLKNVKGDEVFVFVKNAEDAARVDKLNDPSAAMVKRQRLGALQHKGTVQEQHMPDSKIKIKQQAMQQYREKLQRIRNVK